MTAGAEAPAAPRLRPLGVGELLDAAIKVCLAHAGTLMKAVLVVIVPVQILSAIILASTVDDPAFLDVTTTESGTEDADAAFWAGQFVTTLLTGASFLLATGACFRAIAEGWLGRRPDWRESLRFAARRALPLLWISILSVLGVLLGTIALIIPGIFLFVRWVVAYPVLFVEDERGGGALARSSQLVKGRWWQTFLLLVVGFTLAGVLQFVASFGFGLLAFANDSLAFLILITTLGTLLSTALTTPFQAAIVVLLYFDLRVRKEGFDLELLASRLGGGDGSAAAPAGAAPFVPDEVPEEVRRQAPFWPPPPGWRPPGEEPPG